MKRSNRESMRLLRNRCCLSLCLSRFWTPCHRSSRHQGPVRLLMRWVTLLSSSCLTVRSRCMRLARSAVLDMRLSMPSSRLLRTTTQFLATRCAFVTPRSLCHPMMIARVDGWLRRMIPQHLSMRWAIWSVQCCLIAFAMCMFMRALPK